MYSTPVTLVEERGLRWLVAPYGEVAWVRNARVAREFTLRREVFQPVEILRQATSVNAELLQMDGKLGCIAPGAHADLLVVDGDPLSDPALFQNDGRALRAIMRGGQFFKNELH